MRLALVASVFPPLRSSSSVQTRDLAIEFARQGHQIAVMVPSPELKEGWKIEHWNGVEVVRLRALPTTDLDYVRRAIGELLMPFLMLRQLRKSPLRTERWDGIIWYSPTIFLGPIVRALKSCSRCKGYLIIRDIFPEWAVDIGLMRRGLPYLFFKAVANYQYSVADTIGVQTQGNLSYFDFWAQKHGRRVEVLQNWLVDAPAIGCSISVNKTRLAGRKIFVYAGNMGVAQGMGILLDLAESLKHRTDFGFLFVGRGSDAQRLRADAQQRRLDNVVFFDEIDPDEIPGLYEQCHIGLVALDPRHKTHNIPGKFLSYMQAGLPVLASINPGNDLVKLIVTERVGRVCSDTSAKTMAVEALELMDAMSQDMDFKKRCLALAKRLFSPEVAVKQIVSALQARC
ncbi:MAG: glycosyltransferase family 4 protein [Magnetococcales bacterium]|nr:glycosyltransferase family 4 protein [Magnetococcales bacterium]